MSKTERESLKTLKFIAENPSVNTTYQEVDGYIVADLLAKGLVSGLRSRELGRGTEPIFTRLNITIEGKRFIEKNGIFPKLKRLLLNPYIVGIIVAVIGAIASTWFGLLAK